MERRNFILGLGASAAGGSALLGTGAFSRVESERSLSVQVAEDADAYLGLEGCPDSPNSSFTNVTDSGHLEIDMGDSGNDGSGVNSNSVTSFDNVFQIRNQGKEAACVDLQYDPVDVPDASRAEAAGLPLPDQSVVFYKQDARDSGSSNIPNPDGGNLFSSDEIDIDGPNAMPLDVGESVCIGIQTRTFGISSDEDNGGPENLLHDLGDGEELKIVADVGGNCDPETAEERCEIYGIDLTTDGDQAIRGINVGDGGVVVNDVAAGLSDDARDPSDQNKPNGLAFDPSEELFYFSSPTEEAGSLYTVELSDTGSTSETLYENFEDASESEISGAAFAYEGDYHYVLDGDNELKKPTIETVGDPESDVTTEGTGITLPNNVQLGDVAINRDENVVYISSWNPSAFYKIDLDDEEAEDLTGDVDEEFENKQIAYGVDQFGNPQLYGTDAGSGDWYELFPDTGAARLVLEGENDQFTDLAACGEVFGKPPEEENGVDTVEGREISFIAFCPSEGVDGDHGELPDPVIEAEARNEDGELTGVRWDSEFPVEEVVVKAGQQWWVCDAGGATSGVAGTNDDAFDCTLDGEGPSYSPTGSEFSRCGPSPCLGQAGVKLENNDGSFDPDETQETCPRA